MKFEQEQIRNYIASIIHPDGAKQIDIVQAPEELPENLRDEFQDENFILRLAIDFYLDGIPPTASALTAQLVARAYCDLDDAEYIIGEIVNHTPKYASPRTIYKNIETISVDKQIQVAKRKIVEIMSDVNRDYADRYEEALSVLSETGVGISDMIVHTPRQSIDFYNRLQKQRWDARQSGEILGFGLPFEAHKAYFSQLLSGETTLIIGETGVGKTQIADVIGEYNAWELGGCDVVHISTETELEVLYDRMYSRNLNIPFRVVNDGLDVTPKIEKALENFQSYQLEMANTTGYFYRVFAPNDTIDSISMEMIRMGRISAAAGRKILFILDVINEVLPVKGMQNDIRLHMEYVSRVFRKAVKMVKQFTPAHGILVGHQKADSIEVFGSSMVRRQSQLGFEIKRGKFDEESGYPNGAPEDVPYTGKDHKQKRDAIGRKMFYVRKGSEWGHRVELHSIKANNAPPMTIKLIVLGEYSRYMSDSDQIADLVKRGLLEEPSKGS